MHLIFSVGMSKNVSELKFGQDMTKYVKTTGNSNQQFKNISTKGPYGSWSVLMGPDVHSDGCKVTGIIFRCHEDDNNFKTICDILGVNIDNFNPFC